MARSRARSLSRGMAVAAVVAACVDGPTSPGRYGELRIRPIYEAGDEPGALGVTVDSATVRVTRRGEPDNPLIDARVAYNSDTASLAWILDLQSAAESLRVDLTLWGDGTRWYDGADTVEVRDALLDVAAAPVDVGYVGPAIVASVTVTPETDTLDALGATTTLAAVARDRHDAIVPGAAFSWTSGAGAVAGVDPSGVVTAAGNGSTTITATTGNVSGGATVVVRQRVAELAVTPGAITLTALGATQTLGAQPRDANGFAVADAALTWSSDAPGVAAVDPATGLVTAVAGGSATITATSGDVTATAVVTVNPIADVASIVVTPSATTLTAPGATQQYSAEARDAGGTVLTGVQFTWASGATAVATVDAASGLATAVTHGITAITASVAGVSGSAQLTVDLTPTVTTVTVAPATATLTAVGATQQFSAVAHDVHGAVVPGVPFVWTSGTPAVATIDAVSGLATAAGHGASAITATAGGVSGTAALTVDLTPTVASITVTPAAATLTAIGATEQFTAVALDAGGLVVPGVPFIWSSGTTAVATIDAVSGLASAAAHGTTTITATVGGVSGAASLSVDLAPVIASVTVAPPTATLTAVGATQAYSAIARDASGAAVPVAQFEWTSSAPAVATIDPVAGLATALGHGAATITASVGGVSGTAALTVDLSETIATITVTPPAVALEALGATQAFAAEARDGAGNVVAGITFTWSSTSPSIALIDPVTGVATAVANGTTHIVAAAGGVTGQASLAVEQRIVTVVVTPDSVILVGSFAPQQFSAQAFDANGYLVPNVTFEWTTNDPVVAIVDATGLVTPLVYGYALIKATAGGVTGSAWLFVEPGS